MPTHSVESFLVGEYASLRRVAETIQIRLDRIVEMRKHLSLPRLPSEPEENKRAAVLEYVANGFRTPAQSTKPTTNSSSSADASASASGASKRKASSSAGSASTKSSKKKAKTKAKGEKSDKPKRTRPMNGYTAFTKLNREVVQKQNPGANFKELGTLMGQEWHKLSDAEKAEYGAKAKKMQEAKDAKAAATAAATPAAAGAGAGTDTKAAKAAAEFAKTSTPCFLASAVDLTSEPAESAKTKKRKQEKSKSKSKPKKEKAKTKKKRARHSDSDRDDDSDESSYKSGASSSSSSSRRSRAGSD